MALVAVSAASAQTIYSQNFNGLPYGPPVDEPLGVGKPPVDNVWSKTGPAGWTIDDSGVPGAGTSNDGVTEWAGWSFTSPAWWSQVAGDQGRALYVEGEGSNASTGNVIAVADSDEWDDKSHPPGSMTTYLHTPAISVNSAAGNLDLEFETTWQPEGAQKAIIQASFDGGAPVEVMRWESDSGSANFRPAIPRPEDPELFFSTNTFAKPAGATSVRLSFGYLDGNNNWYWGVDNINLRYNGSSIYSEDFEGVDLGPNVDEDVVVLDYDPQQVWTKTAPTGWTHDDSGVPGINDGVGRTEWRGWSFANRNWWSTAVDRQRREEFTLANGGVAIADPDEWDDGSGDPDSLGLYNTLLSTQSISLAGVDPNSLKIEFDSSWRDEAFDDFPNPCGGAEEPPCINNQTAVVRVSYDGGAPIEVLRWESDENDPNFHDDNPNEHVRLALNNPAGAQNVTITFGLLEASNDWWWAIDNLVVREGALSDLNGDGAVDAADAAVMFAGWGAGGVSDLNGDGVTDAADAGLMFGEWTGDTVPASVPEPAGLSAIACGLVGWLLVRRRK